MTTEERVKNVISNQLGVKLEDVKNYSSFVDDLGAEPMDVAALVQALEQEFETIIPDEIVERMTTVQAALDYFKSTLQ